MFKPSLLFRASLLGVGLLLFAGGSLSADPANSWTDCNPERPGLCFGADNVPSSGVVGIGTQNPDPVALHIVDYQRTPQLILERTDNEGDSYAKWSIGVGSNWFTLTDMIQSQPRFFIDDAGRAVIGTVAVRDLDAGLSVAGMIKATGGYKFPDGSIQTKAFNLPFQGDTDSAASAFRVAQSGFGTAGEFTRDYPDCGGCPSRVALFAGTFGRAAAFRAVNQRDGGAGVFVVKADPDPLTNPAGTPNPGLVIRLETDYVDSLAAGVGNFIEAYRTFPSNPNTPPDLKFAVWNDGDVTADGDFTGGGADFADLIPVAGSLADYEPGDVLMIASDGNLIKADRPNSTAVAGVYSTDPAFIADPRGAISGPNEESNSLVPLALAGVVPVKVTDENGPIVPGDLLVTSSMPGYAMKASPVVVNGVEIYPTGAILGKAMQTLEEGTGVIQVLVMLR